jgi:hypothetical protein
MGLLKRTQSLPSLCSHSIALAGALPFCTITRYAVHKQLSQVLETNAQFLTTNQPVRIVILAGVYACTYISWDCLGVRTSLGTRVPRKAVYLNLNSCLAWKRAPCPKKAQSRGI